MNDSKSSLPEENIAVTKPKVFQHGPLKACKMLIQMLSTNTRRREPPPHKNINDNDNDNKRSLTHVRLITIGPSHYCEKVRWALDMLEHDPQSPIYYTEDAHPPLFQSIATLEASHDEASMVPMVIYENQKTNTTSTTSTSSVCHMHDSQKILQHFCPNLYPPKYRNDIMRLESYFGSHLGSTARCVIYQSMLGVPEYTPTLVQWLTMNTSSVERIVFEKIFEKGIAGGMRKVMNINEDAARESLSTLRRVFEEVSDMLKVSSNNRHSHSKSNDDDGGSGGSGSTTMGKKRAFIMDNDDENVGFTAADLTFSSLASALIQPPELALIAPPFEDGKVPRNLLDLREELRNTLAGRHVMEMYRTQRTLGRRFVQPKVVNRDVRTLQAIKKIVSKL